MKPGNMRCGEKLARKTVEKNRRILMKHLCFNLVSLIPDHYLTQPKKLLSQQDQIDHSAAYIEVLRERVEELKRKKAQLMMIHGTNNVVESRHPILTVKELCDSNLEVVLVSGLRKKFRLHHVIAIIEQEAAQVLTVNISTIDDQIFHSIHAQVKFPRVGVDIARISERIHDLISSTL